MMTRSSRHRYASSLALGALALALSTAGVACSDDDDTTPGAGGSAGTAGGAGAAGLSDAGPDGTAGAAGGGADAAGNARLRVVHASSDAPAVDVYAKGNATPLVANLAYGKASSYLELPAGSYQVELRAAGASPTDAPAFETPALEVLAGKTYTAIAAGSLASSADDDKFRVMALEEGFGASEAGKVRVRVVHAGFDAPTVDLDVGNDNPAAPELSGLARFADTGVEGVPLPAATALQIGLAASGKTVTAFTTPSLPDQSSLFVVAAGQIARSPRDATGFALLAVLADGTTAWLKQNPFVYALHASPDAPAVDVYAGSAELIDNVAFAAMGRIQVAPGSYTLDFFPGQAGATPKPSTNPAVSLATPELGAGETYLTIATGLLASAGADKFQFIHLAEGFSDVPDGKALVRAAHASPDAPAVDLGTVTTSGTLDPSALVYDLAFPNATEPGGAALSAGGLTLGVAAKGTTSTVAEFALAPTAGQRLFAIATGMLAPAQGQKGFGLMVVDATSTNITSPWGVVAVAPKP
ncbi:MAG TPA: DUF4397 domain-containing protein [Polyangiaceae bacterium]|nr:DUF4397 domain-containing protein [Polyangiaceae bacterium]